MRGLTWSVVALVIGAGSLGAQTDPLDPGRVPHLTLTELTRIGGDDAREGYVLSGVRGVVVASPDEVLVVDGGSKEVRSYGVDGLLKGKLGGEGKGPGEFKAPRDVAVLPDGHLLTWDIQLQRVTRFGPDGSVVGTGVPENTEQMTVMFSEFVGALSDGSWVQRVNGDPFALRNEPEGERRDTVLFKHIGADGTFLGQIVAVEGPRRILMKEGGGWGDETPIFGRELRAELSGDVLLVGLNDAIHFRRFKPDGTELAPLDVPRPPQPATRKRVAFERQRQLEKAEAAAEAAKNRSDRFGSFMADAAARKVEQVKKMEAEESVPAYDNLMTSAEGDVWIRAWPDESTPERRWFRLGDDFRPTGWLDLPENSRLVAVGHGLLVAVARDELDVETVVVYRID